LGCKLPGLPDSCNSMIDIQFKKQSKGVEKELQSSAPQMMPHHSMIFLPMHSVGTEQKSWVSFFIICFDFDLRADDSWIRHFACKLITEELQVQKHVKALIETIYYGGRAHSK
jgi:hypothetical protein